MKAVHRYIILGGSYADMAHLHTLAQSSAEALQKWRDHFGDKVEGWPDPPVDNIDTDRPDLAKHWKGNGYDYYYRDRGVSV